MHFNNHLHLNIHAQHQLKKFREGIYPLYLAHSIKGFVGSLIGFFIPIYLLKIGFTLTQILSFFGVRSFFMIFFVIITGGIGNKIGLRHTMAISLPLILLYLILMMLLEKNVSLFNLYVLSIVGAFGSALYWIPLHTLFARFTTGKTSSSQVSILLSLKSLSSIVAPLLGGFITVTFGFKFLFIIAIIILMIPILVLLGSKDIHPHINFSLTDLLRFFREHKRHFLSIMLDSFGAFAEEIIWPLFVFIILASEMSVGIVGSLVGIGTITFTILFGGIIARHNYFLIMKISAFMLAVTWIIRYFIGNNISIYIVSLLAGLATIMFSIPLASHTYKIAKDSKDIDEFIVFKEILVHGSKIFAIIISIIVVSNINISFLMTGIGYLLITLL